jgi:hypothetical protein
MKLDLGNLITTYASINPRTVSGSDTSAVDGTGIDRRGYESAVLVFQVGAVAGSPTGFTVTCVVSDSSDDSTYTAISTIDSVVITATNTKQEVSVPLVSVARYVRGEMTTAITGGTTPIIAITCLGILGAARVLPA